MAKIGEVLKRDLKRQRTAQVESDSDDTCCDTFDQPKKRKPEAIAALCATSDDEDAIPQVESQRPGAVPAVFVEMNEDTLKAPKDAVRERFPNREVTEIRSLLRRKCNNE
ncbi:unnamed protein product [Merluccius merluccius]